MHLFIIYSVKPAVEGYYSNMINLTFALIVTEHFLVIFLSEVYFIYVKLMLNHRGKAGAGIQSNMECKTIL